MDDRKKEDTPCFPSDMTHMIPYIEETIKEALDIKYSKVVDNF